MPDLRQNMVKFLHQTYPQDGMHETPITGVHCIKISTNDKRTKRHWRAALFIALQGRKEIVLGHDTLRPDDTVHYVVAPIDLPITSRVMSATAQQPFICLRIDFDLLNLNAFPQSSIPDEPADATQPLRSIFIGPVSTPMLDATHRLVGLMQNPEDAAALGPLVIRELFYHFLKTPDGAAIRQFLRSGSKMHKISQVIHSLIAELTYETDVNTLARQANMSRSAFFKHFKEATALSPIQYQKRLRLLEARRLMTDEGESAEGSAYKVGYNSASQFSREYARMFGNSPLRDVIKIKKSGQVIHAM